MSDIDLTRIKALVFDVDGVLSDSTVAMDVEGQPLRTLNVKDGYALQLAVKRGLAVAIISGGKSPNIRQRYEYLGVRHIYMGASYKLHSLQDFCERTGIPASDILYMGDDIPDYEVMLQVGFPTCPSDAAPEIRSISSYVSPCRGGEGAARDVIEQVLKAQGQWMTDNILSGW